MSRSRPSRISSRLARILPLALSIFILPTLVAAQTCYDRSGKARSNWKACNPSGSADSTCCSASDFCMSNGLCLNAGGNQAYSQQGCTDKTWNSTACIFYCQPGAPDDGLYYLEYCWQGLGKPGDQWCCGVGCCDGGTSTSKVTIPIANQIYKAGSLQSGGSTPAGSASTSPSASSTAPGSPPAQGDNGNTNVGGSGVSMGLVLGVALGLGIPLLLIAAAFAWFYVRNKKVSSRPSPSGKEVAYPASPPGQEQGWYVPPSTQSQWSRQQDHQVQHKREQQWSQPSELEIDRPPAELDVQRKSGW